MHAFTSLKAVGAHHTRWQNALLIVCVDALQRNSGKVAVLLQYKWQGYAHHCCAAAEFIEHKCQVAVLVLCWDEKVLLP